MNKKIRSCFVFMIIILCFLAISSPVFAEAGMSEIIDEEWKEFIKKCRQFWRYFYLFN